MRRRISTLAHNRFGVFTENSIEQVERILANLHSFPPAKVYKRLTNGAEDNVWIYYKCFDGTLPINLK